jgi:hypothetical protein
MARGLSRAFGVLTMIVTMLMGISGRLQASPAPGGAGMCLALAPAAARPVAASARDVVYQLREQVDGSLVVTAVSSELSFKKTVYADGRTEATFERGRDRVSVVTTTAAVTVSRGASTITLDYGGTTEEGLGRVRTLWAASPALRAFRSLAAALEEDEDDASPEGMALRLTGALVAQLDGDDGAVPRLARKLRLRFGGPERRVRYATADCWSIYVDGVNRAANDLEKCYSYFSIWDPRRLACSFVWTVRVEGAWFGYLSCSSVPLK